MGQGNALAEDGLTPEEILEGMERKSDESQPEAASRPQITQERSGSSHQTPADDRLSQWYCGPVDPDAGFTDIDGDVNGPTGYNETKVDIVCVPCPGADPIETWMRDPLPANVSFTFSNNNDQTAPESRNGADSTANGVGKGLAGGGGGESPHIVGPQRLDRLWVQQGIRSHVSSARVLLYRHRQLSEGLNLETLAQDLLREVWAKRHGSQRSRPLFFLGHSIGGLVIKLALLNASRSEEFRPFWYNCHGVAFFGTPHRGSSYMSMKNLRESIQQLLHLQAPLPRSIASVLRLDDNPMAKLREGFAEIASELRIWTFYETFDSQLSGSGSGLVREVQFGAPLVSIKSSILGLRREQAFALESDHSHCASFGAKNLRTMRAYLKDFSAAVLKAQDLSSNLHHPLNLKETVKVELVGFYEDPEAEVDVRLYTSKHHLAEFLKKGPEKCLDERLKTLSKKRSGGPHIIPRQPTRREEFRKLGDGAQGGFGGVRRPIGTSAEPEVSTSDSKKVESPEITLDTEAAHGASPFPSGLGPSPLRVQPQGEGLAVPGRPSTGSSRPPSRGSVATAGTTRSDPTGENLSPKSQGKGEADRELAIAPSGSTASARPSSGAGQQPVAKTHPESQGNLGNTGNLGEPPTRSPDTTAGFSRPEPNRRKFMWIHMPFMNPPWVKDIFTKLSETHGSLSKLFNNEHWVSKHVSGRHSLSQPSFVKPACGFVFSEHGAGAAVSPRLCPSSPGAGASGRGRSVSSAAPPLDYMYLYLPYLHYDTYLNMIRRRRLILRRLAHGRARPVPEDIADLESLELRVIWEFLGYDPSLNCRMTLDQFGYPSLQDTFARDDDQMLYKLTKEDSPVAVKRGQSQLPTDWGDRESRFTSPADRVARAAFAGQQQQQPITGEPTEQEDGSDDEIDDYADLRDGNVLMVDQLWLWSIDKTTLATFFPKRESHPTEGTLFQQADLRNSVYNELNGDLAGRTENALDLAAFITLHAVTVLLDRSSHQDLDVFRIFDEAIGMLTDRMTSSLKRFRMQTFKQVAVDDSDSDSDLDLATGNRSRNIKKRHRLEIEKAERENRESTSALLELRDLEDELTTLNKLFETQAGVVRPMAAAYASEHLRRHTLHGRAYLAEALVKLDEYRAACGEMLRRVDTTRKDYEKLLEMAQRQAQVDDVRWSRLQTELASSSNLSVMILTIFSVLFLPLTFLTGVWGMNTSDWQGSGGGEGPLPLSTIGAVSLPLSALLIVASLAGAFSSRVQRASRAVYKRGKAAAVYVGRDLPAALLPARARRGRGRREGGGARRRTGGARARVDRRDRREKVLERGYDFWGSLKEGRRRRRGSQYEIPESNRKRSAAGLGVAGLGPPAARGTWSW